MLVLGIESSCDETAASVVENHREVLSDVVSTQVELHRRFGGVVPEVASRNHLKNILPVVEQALRDADISLSNLDGIAVTSGPGLQGALLVGLQVAKTLAYACQLPLVGVNHLEGHLLAARLGAQACEPPFVALVASGGHTVLYHVPEIGRYLRLGGTRDDAAGEAFDKVARLLGLPYPGGQPIDERAQTGDPKAIRFPRALQAPDSLDYSFSGLKTSVAEFVKANPHLSEQALADVCASFQEAVADALTKKLIEAARQLHVPRVVLCGGVAANSRLRSMALEKGAYRELDVVVPEKKWCTDNGAMIALAGSLALARGLRSDLSLNAQPSWRL